MTWAINTAGDRWQDEWWQWQSVYSLSYFYKYPKPVADQSIWLAWRHGLESLHYLYRPYFSLVLRRTALVTRRSDPRWRSGRWKSKT